MSKYNLKKQAKDTWNAIWLFCQNIPMTIKDSLIWFIMTYLMPVVQIFIIWGIRQTGFEWSIEIMNIILVTNASLYSAIIMLVTGTSKAKGFFHIVTITAYVFTVVLFAISMVELNIEDSIFNLSLYQTGTIITLIFALILGLISKFDEVKAKRVDLAKCSKKIKEVELDKEEIAL